VRNKRDRYNAFEMIVGLKQWWCTEEERVWTRWRRQSRVQSI